MRIVSATVGSTLAAARPVGRRRPADAATPQQRQGEGDPRAGAAVGPILDAQPAAVGLDEPAADEQPEPGPGDPRLADVPGPMERLGDERPFRGRDPDALVVDGDRRATPRRPRRSTVDEPVRRPVLEGVADEVLEDLADPRPVDLERRQVVGQRPRPGDRPGRTPRGRPAAG